MSLFHGSTRKEMVSQVSEKERGRFSKLLWFKGRFSKKRVDKIGMEVRNSVVLALVGSI